MMRIPQFDRFDVVITGVIVLLLIAIGGVIAAGDQVGVYVVEDGYSPVDTASGATSIRLHFSEAMLPTSVEDNFHLEPAVTGNFDWSQADTLIFHPVQPLSAGQAYTVSVGAEARAANRAATLASDFSWTFKVRLPRAVFLSPSDALENNLVVADLETGETYPLLATEQRIEDFAVSPDGRQIAYTVMHSARAADIWVLDVATRTPHPVTNCVKAHCSGPAWNHNSSLLAYQRFDFSAGAGTSRTWIVDLNSLETALLFADPHILGQSPRWSPMQDRIAVFDVSIPGIRVLDYRSGTEIFIDSIAGGVGPWSPGGNSLIFPTLSQGAVGDLFYDELEIIDMSTQTRRPLIPNETAPSDNSSAQWSPDGQRIAITRQYFDERFTNSKQIYLLDWESQAITPLVVDANYYHSSIHWDASGQRLIFQRFPFAASGEQIEVWYLDLATNQLEKLSDNGMFPDWLP